MTAQVWSPAQVISSGVSERSNAVQEAARREREQAVLAAARDERRERKALEALGSPRPGWIDAQEDAHRVQLERWLAASRRLSNALTALQGGSPSRLMIRRI
jgi:hypothetical protein